MALTMKQLIVQNKTRRARIRAIKKLLATIPAKPTFEYYDDDYERGYGRGEAALANSIRKILNDPAFKPAYQPGNTDNGKPKSKGE